MPVNLVLLQNFVQSVTISDALSLLLALVLAGLYVLTWRTQQRQADILERQADIQENQVEIQGTQNEIMAQQTGILAVDYTPDIWKSTQDGTSIRIQHLEGRDVFSICLANKGQGKAKNLIMGCVVYLKDESEDVEPTYKPAWMIGDKDYTISTDNNHLVRSDLDDEEDRELLQNVIAPGETGVWFQSEVLFTINPRNRDPFRVTFAEVVNRIKLEWGISEIGLEFHVSYSDVVGRTESGRVASIEDIELNEDMTLEEAIQSGNATNRNIRDFVPDEYIEKGNLEELEDRTAE